MSIESLAIALNHSRASGTAKVIILGIASHDGDGGAWPSMATLARYGNCSVRNARKAVERLVELGEIKRLANQGGTAQTPEAQRPNLYRFQLRCPPSCDGSSQHRDLNALPRSISTPPVKFDLPPRSNSTAELSFNHPTNKLRDKPSVSNRARVGAAPTIPHVPARISKDECGWLYGHNPATFDPETGTCKRCREDSTND